MRYAYRCGDYRAVKSHPGMIQEEFGAERIKRRVKKLFDAGDINFAIFRSRMIAMHEQCGGCHQNQRKIWLAPEQPQSTHAVSLRRYSNRMVCRLRIRNS